MYKKIGLILLSLVLVFNFTLNEYSEAAVASKVATQAAKQAVKVPIKDLTKEVAFELAQRAIAQNFNPTSQYKFEENYAGYCVSEIKSDGSCSKMMQIKKDLTVEDYTKIDNQLDSEIDKTINGGKGFTRWQKIMDWFMPVWLLSAGYTAITFAMDGDIREMFREIAYNTLVSIGVIKPVTDIANPTSLEEEELEQTPIADTSAPDKEVKNIVKTTSGSYTGSHTFENLNIHSSDIVASAIIENPEINAKSFSVSVGDSTTSLVQTIGIDVRNRTIHTASTMKFTSLVVRKNGEVVSSATFTPRSMHIYPVEFIGNARAYQARLPYQIGLVWYTDFVARSDKGDTYHFQMQSDTTPVVNQNINTLRIRNDNSEYPRGHYIYQVHKEKNPFPVLPLPTFEESSVIDYGNNPTPYENEKGELALVPPDALPYKEESTGDTVYRTPSTVPAEPPIFKKEDGTIVPEDNVIVGPAPPVVPAPNGMTDEKGKPIPEGTPVVTPTPTPSNPTPAPIPLTPTEPVAPVEPPVEPPAEPPVDGEPIPDGPGCEEKFKFPILSPLKETFSTSFPFSIPWDIERAINAAFSGIGHEKPKFNLDLNVLGQKETIEITTPKMFDDWKPFTDTLLVLTFDVLIMFGVYRFVKGAGS